jgi:aspartyl-tRNA(Asn)/glutamyl-tRNA(Gln) amidotransferase subunit A
VTDHLMGDTEPAGRQAAGVQDAVAAAAERADRLDPLLGTFVRRFTEESAAAAKQLDDQDTHGAERGVLHGMLIAVKDLIAVREVPTTGQSKVYDRDWWAGRDALAVERLRLAGAVIVGKTTMAEHGLARPDPSSGFPVPRNPWDLDRWPGGSSCGSANGLPAGLFTAALGTDSNGSLRIPAAMCGVTGIKPTHGLVPVSGCLPLGRSVDAIGPLARNVRDGARVLTVLAGHDLAGPAAASWWRDLSGIRIGVPLAMLGQANLTGDCERAFSGAVSELQSAGAGIVPVDLPETLPLLAAELVTMLAEAFEVHREQLRQQWEDFGRPFRRMAVLGGLIDAATYLRAQRVRRWAVDALLRRLSDLDAIATPTWPAVAPRYDDAARLQEMSALPGIWNSAGFPAIAVPMGMSDDGLPLSLQLAGAPWSDFRLAAMADVYQQRTGWHLLQPSAFTGVQPAPVTVAGGMSPATGSEPPGKAGADAEAAAALTQIGRTVQALGVPVKDEELPFLLHAWSGISRLASVLADPPAEVGPLSTVSLGTPGPLTDRRSRA